MSFSKIIKEKVLVACGRHCCICHKFCGTKIEHHHIISKNEGGLNNFDNCIPLCFDCHADMRSYDYKHPKGTKYTPSELKQHRDRWYEKVKGSIKLTKHIECWIAENSSKTEQQEEPKASQVKCSSPITVPPLTPLFQGREEDVAKVIELIGNEKNKIVAVTGPPGQGKTEFVKALAHTLKQQGKYPNGIFWASKREDEKKYPLKNLESIFDAVLKGKGISGVEKIHFQEKEKRASEVLESGKALLVLDNFETEDDADGADDAAIIAYLQGLSPSAKFLIATRRNMASPLVRKYILSSLSNDGLPLFLNLLEQDGYFDNEQIVPNDELWAKKICHMLNGHPLSLLLAAGNVPYNSLEEIASKLENDPYLILQPESRPPGTPIGLWKSIDLSLSPLSEHDPVSHDLFLKLSLFFSPTCLAAIQAVLGKDCLESSLKTLLERHLVERTRKGLYFFLPVLRMVSSNLLKNSNIKVKGYHRKAADYFKKQEVPDSVCALDHLKWLCDKQGVKQAGKEMVTLMTHVNTAVDTALFKLGYWNLDEEKLNQTLTVIKKIQFPEGEIEILTRLGWLRHHKGDLAHAEKLHLEAKEICKRLKDQFKVALQLKHLGWVYLDQGKLDKAEEKYMKSQNLFEKEKNSKDQDRVWRCWKNQADILSARGAIYKMQEKFDIAEKKILLALRISTKHLKKEAADLICRIWSNLGGLYLSQGKLNEAQRFLQKSFHIAQLRNDLPRQVENSRDLTQVYLSLGNFEKGEFVLLNVLSSIEKIISGHQQATSDDLELIYRFQTELLENLGHIYRNQKKFEQAEHAHKKSLAINKQIGSQGGEAYSRLNLGELYRDKKDFSRAEEAFKISQNIRESLNRKSGTNLHELGLLYIEKGKLDEAEQILTKALSIYEGRPPCLVREWGRLAQVYWRQGDTAKANSALDKVLIFVDKLSNTFLQRWKIDILNTTAHICIELEKYAMAEKLFKKVMNINKYMGSKICKAQYLADIGILFKAKGNIPQAVTYTKEALKLFVSFGYVLQSKAAAETLNRLHAKRAVGG